MLNVHLRNTYSWNCYMALPTVKPGLLRHPLDSQVLVYDPTADTVHLLERGPACVLELLEEKGWTVDGMLAELERRVGLEADESYLKAAIDDINSAGLLAVEPVKTTLDLPRRDF